MGRYRIILSGGGTGGHIFPAVAIANELKRRHPDTEFLFVGAKDKMEMEKVPQAGYKIMGLWISGLQRKLTIKNLMFPFKLINSLTSARNIIKNFNPDLAVGTGGFASGPTMKAAAWAKVPYVLQEQNSFAGITNKLAAKKAEKIFVAYDGMERFFPKEKILKTGNPVRADLIDSNATESEAFEHFELDSNKPVLLVLGGSLGARRINQLIASKLEYFNSLGMQVIWQCGKLYYEDYKKHDSGAIKVHAFLNRMDLAYSAAQLIISRAGAGSVSELCIVGKPVLFIPSPNVAEDHQTKNAKALVERNAASMIAEKDLDEKFEEVFQPIVSSNELQNTLAENIKRMAMPKATMHIVDEIEKLLK